MTTFVDILSIPDTMQTYATITRSIAIAIIPVLFVLGILKEQAKLVGDEKPEFASHIYTTIAVFLGLILYKWIFLKIISFCEAIGMSVASLQDWYELQSTLSLMADKLSGSVLTLSVVQLLAKTFYIISSVAEIVFNLFRYALLSFLYILGPIAFALAVFPLTRNLVKGWFINIFQISFWIITLRILQATMLMLGFTTAIENGGIFYVLVMSILFIGMIIMTPILTAKLISGENIGTMASAAMAATTAISARFPGTYKNFKGGVSKAGKILAASPKTIHSIATSHPIKNVKSRVNKLRASSAEKKIKKRLQR